jgi:hypothetical protein
MHGPVKRGLRIELPSTRDDELPLRSLVATSLACLALGLAVAYGLADREAPRASSAAEPAGLAPSASAAAEQAEPIAVAPTEPAPPVEPPPPVEPTPPIEPPAAAIAEAAPAPRAPDAAISSEPAMSEPPAIAPVEEPAPPVAATAAAIANDPPQPEATPEPAGDPRRLVMKTGVFAYLRCEGVKQRPGKYPCPRDRDLEARMRTIIEALPTCREAHAIPRGRSFDLRLELGPGGTFKELQVKGPNEAAERAVRACAGPGLRKERTELNSTRMIVSMRFKAH